jgi:hypothetical protein
VANGYRLSRLFITPTRQLQPELAFDQPEFGSGGLSSVLRDVISAALSESGESDEKSSSYFRVDEAASAPCVIAVTASGGGFGEEKEVVNINDHSPKNPISADDAVLSRMLFLIVLPTYGTSGVLLSHVRGRSHLTPGLMKRLNRHLDPKGWHLRLEKDVADEVAWSDYLGEDDVEVKSVELIQRHASADRTNFVGAGVESARVILRITGEEQRRGVLQAMRDSVAGRRPPALAGLVGMTAANDDDFDDQKIVYVQDKRERTITINNAWPIFIHELDVEGEIGIADLLGLEVRDDVKAVLTQLGIDMPPGWWPSVSELETIG